MAARWISGHGHHAREGHQEVNVRTSLTVAWASAILLTN
jgi:hypothetical protein